MSKHAVLGLTKSLALDHREYNIVCSQLDIGEWAKPKRCWSVSSPACLGLTAFYLRVRPSQASKQGD
jgi:NAD(P)-dependent dehydrogenase (short-subunit alcohol dehydrogenase family)